VARPPLTPEQFAAEANVSRDALERLRAYAALLTKWQAAINLVGRDTLDDPWRRHMLDSAQLVRHLPAGARVVTDLGSGAGFPGLVLAIVAGLHVHLVESTGRKTAFLQEAARLTGARVTIHRARIESIDPWPSDVVTARALAPLTTLLELGAPFLHSATPDVDPVCLFLKGAQAEQELTDARKSWKLAVERFPSLAEPAGCVLRIRGVSRE
jgi:16S rRNA (guanine527-N7)-methyltransferase